MMAEQVRSRSATVDDRCVFGARTILDVGTVWRNGPRMLSDVADTVSDNRTEVKL
jgi:hypothetical protein